MISENHNPHNKNPHLRQEMLDGKQYDVCRCPHCQSGSYCFANTGRTASEIYENPPGSNPQRDPVEAYYPGNRWR